MNKNYSESKIQYIKQACYKDLIVWQKAKIFCVGIYKFSEKLPKSEIYGLTSQLRRATISIPSNIAEGSRRRHGKEQIQFYSIAYGSGAEIETQLEIAKDLFPFLINEICLLEKQLEEIMKMLNRLISVRKLQTTNYKLQTNKGFTLIETLVMIMVTAILAGIIITYSHVGEKQIVLFRDQAQVISILNKAKSLAIQMSSPELISAIDICGYGVHFGENGDKQTYFIFKILKNSGSCANAYDDDSFEEKIEEYKLDSRLEFNTFLTDVKFIPPNPKTKLNNSDSITEETIIIKIKGESISDVKIKINNAGQITVQ